MIYAICVGLVLISLVLWNRCETVKQDADRHKANYLGQLGRANRIADSYRQLKTEMDSTLERYDALVETNRGLREQVQVLRGKPEAPTFDEANNLWPVVTVAADAPSVPEPRTADELGQRAAPKLPKKGAVKKLAKRHRKLAKVSKGKK